jgi:hypothetical protein
MSVLRDFLSRFATGMKGPEPGERSYEELIVREGTALPGSYRFDEEQREGARDITRGLADFSSRLACSREDERDIIRLLVRTDPFVDRACDYLADALKGKVPIAANEVNQPVFAELTVVIFWLGDSIAISKKDFACGQTDCAFLIQHVVEQPNDHSPRFQAPNLALFADQDGRQMSSIAVGQVVGAAVIKPKEQCRVFFLGRSAEQLAIE